MTATRLTPGSDAEALDWPALLARAVTGAGLVSYVQPIVDLARATVVGYEALVRFPGCPVADPETWFAAARVHGRSAELEAAALRSALALRADLPVNCFLSVNVGPDVLLTPEVQQVWDEQPRLDAVVVELTEHARIESYVDLEPALDGLRGRGALVAIDDAGSGYSGLQHLLAIRPAIIKLDRTLVSDLDRDEAKRALVETIGLLASRIDAWILAEGIERAGELDALVQLGVPLAQGYLLARPGPAWVGLEPDVALRLLRSVPDPTDGSVLSLVEETATSSGAEEAMAAFAEDDVHLVVVLDEHRRPVATVDPEGLVRDVRQSSLKVNARTPVRQAAERALTRAPGDRFRPLLCIDDAGRFVGVVRMERVVGYLARTGQP